MQKYNSPTRGKLHRCWCWVESKLSDNGYKPVSKPYSHSENCKREQQRAKTK